MPARVAGTWDRKVAEIVAPPEKVIVPQFAVKATAQLRAERGIAPVPMAKAEALARRVIVRMATAQPRAVKGIVLVRMAKAEALVPKVIIHAPQPMASAVARVVATVAPKELPVRDASTRKRCGSNSTRTAMAASRRKKLPSG